MNEATIPQGELIALMAVVSTIIVSFVVWVFRRFSKWGSKDAKQGRIVRDINRN